MSRKISSLLVIAFSLLLKNAIAQCDGIATMCEQHINSEYISDGQTYRALLNGDDVAEFQATFYGGNTYRIAACSGVTDGNLIFRIFDSEKNLLFTNASYSTAPYWDFYVENTIQVTIESKLDSNKSDSGCAVLVIGFKR
jgi:hypothetical protein